MYIVNSVLLHIFMILSIVALAIWMIAKREKIAKNETFHSKRFALFTLIVWVMYNIYNFLPENFRVEESLPLHVCDVLAIVSVIALWSGNVKARTFIYFCALPLATQAIITPTGEQNPLLFRFWLFWMLHACIILSSIYDLVVRKYRPAFKSYLFIIFCDILYILLILPINIFFNFNYGFIGNSSPDTPTMVDVFGAWPIRILWMLLAVLFVQFLMYLPWRIRKRSK